jgi:hypothetical protein
MNVLHDLVDHDLLLNMHHDIELKNHRLVNAKIILKDILFVCRIKSLPEKLYLFQQQV